MNLHSLTLSILNLTIITFASTAITINAMATNRITSAISPGAKCVPQMMDFTWRQVQLRKALDGQCITQEEYDTFNTTYGRSYPLCDYDENPAVLEGWCVYYGVGIDLK